MARTHRLSTTGALIVCLVGTQWSGTLFASEQAPTSQSVVNGTSEAQGLTSASPAAAVATGVQSAGEIELIRSTAEHSRFTFNDEMFAASASLGPASGQLWRGTPGFVPVDSSSFAQWGGFRGRGRGGRNGGAQTAIFLGAVASITGAAVLVYANRPECNTNQLASGCGYGTKVVGGAVLSAGIVGLLVGALTWR